MERNPMYYCLSCDKYLGFRGFCSEKCHNEYYDSFENLADAQTQAPVES